MSSDLIQIQGAEDVVLVVDDFAYRRRAEAIDGAQLVKRVADPVSQQMAADALRELKAIQRDVEASRKAIKAPVLKIGRLIDSTADEFAASIVTEVARLQGLLTTYELEQRRIAAEAERKRQEEIRRQQEEEARRQAELRAQQERAEREAEEARQAAKAATDAEAQAAARKAQAEAEQRRRDLEAKQQAEAEASAVRQAELLRSAPVAPARAEGTVVRDCWTFEVIDAAALYAAAPDLVELTPKRSDILALIRSGTREIPGLRIYNHVKVGVRG